MKQEAPVIKLEVKFGDSENPGSRIGEMWLPGWPHLWDDVLSEFSVFGDNVGHTNRDQVSESLNLMDDCISVWHFGPVIKGWSAM